MCCRGHSYPPTTCSNGSVLNSSQAMFALPWKKLAQQRHAEQRLCGIAVCTVRSLTAQIRHLQHHWYIPLHSVCSRCTSIADAQQAYFSAIRTLNNMCTLLKQSGAYRQQLLCIAQRSNIVSSTKRNICAPLQCHNHHRLQISQPPPLGH